MTAKIDWYREVLELEPNSKVFFPLARLLAEEGQTDEAIGILEEGVKRHPEYLEARLFLIELLHRQHRTDVCNTQIAQLSKMFASYAGFWEAWAACLASDQGNEDTASIIRFLAAHFVSGPIKLHDVLNRGLDAMLKDGSATAAQTAAIAQGAQPASAQEEFAANPAAMLADLDAELGEMCPHEDVVPEESSVEDWEAPEESALPEEDLTAEAETLPVAEPQVPEEAATESVTMPEELALPEEDAMAEAETLPMVEPQSFEEVAAEPVTMPEEMALPEEDAMAEAQTLPVAEPQGPEEAAAEPVTMPEELALPEEDAMAEAETLPVVEDDSAASLEAAVEAVAAEALVQPLGMEEEAALPEDDNLPEPPAPEFAPDAVARAEANLLAGMEMPPAEPEDEFGEEETFSLRTRSMAEVLAEQGDLAGALDIYQELAQAATSADEVEDIERRMATLSARLNMAKVSAGSAVDEVAAARSKEQLLGMLQTLADRVEARAQG